jgi:nucleotide-binding universal stress UspA family protein
VIGSVANGVLRRAGVPTFVVHAHGSGDSEPVAAIRRIVVDIDRHGWLTPHVELALDLAVLHNARIFFVHVAPDSDDSVVDQGHALRIAANRGVAYDVVRGSGNAPHAVLNVATAVGADLIVIGSRERGAGRLLRPSISELVVRSSPIPVAVAGDRPSTYATSLRPSAGGATTSFQLRSASL